MTTLHARYVEVCERLHLNVEEQYLYKAKLLRVYEYLVQVFGDDEQAIARWMHIPKEHLNEAYPKDLIETANGLDQIKSLLRRELEMHSIIG